MFLILPVAVSYRAARKPLVTLWMIGLCSAVFLLLFLSLLGPNQEGAIQAFVGLAFVPAQASWHRWFTHVFIHAGLLHLLGNLVYLYIFGSCVEDILGRGWYVGFFLVAGAVAALGYALTNAEGWESARPMVGASGAISACMGAFAVLLRRVRVEFRFIYYLIVTGGSREFYLPAWLIISIWFLLDLLMMLAAMADPQVSVAFGAHVAGFVFGAVVGAGLRMAGWRPAPEDDGPTQAVGKHVVRTAASFKAEVEEENRTTFLWIDGTQSGPFAIARIREMRSLSSIPPDALFWDARRGEWRPVQEL